MTRLSFFFTSLIAAIPAAVLGYLCVAAFLFYADALPPALMAVAGITLLLCVLLVAMPVYVLLKTRDRTATVEAKLAASADDAGVEEASASEEAMVAADEGEDVFVEGSGDEFAEFDDTPRKK